MIYQIPSPYLFRIHHVRPRFKNNVEQVLLYMATSIRNLECLQKNEFNEALNNLIIKFEKNATLEKKTINNWRTEISTFFAFIESHDNEYNASLTAQRLANHQYLDEFFNYFLYTFQYPAGHTKPQDTVKQIEANIKFKPCHFILSVLIEGEKILQQPFSVNKIELTQCAFFDLRVIANHTKSAYDVALEIINNRKNKVEYSHLYEELKNSKGEFLSSGDTYRYAGDILDYMALANLLDIKGYNNYYLNKDNQMAIDFHLNNPVWFNGYDKYYYSPQIPIQEIRAIQKDWIRFVNSFDNIEAFKPHLGIKEMSKLTELLQEYYSQLFGQQKVSTKLIGDYGESLILGHEWLRTEREDNKRRHLINKIPTPLGVGYDIQSIEIPFQKRYIEVKTTKSKKALNNNRVTITPNEWDSAITLKDRYFIYYLVINENSKRVFIIQNPVKQLDEGKLKLDKNWVVEFTEGAGQWEQLLEFQN